MFMVPVFFICIKQVPFDGQTEECKPDFLYLPDCFKSMVGMKSVCRPEGYSVVIRANLVS